MRVSGDRELDLGRGHETDEGGLGLEEECRAHGELGNPHLARALSPLDPNWGSLGLPVTLMGSRAPREPGEGTGEGMQSWRKPWRLSPMRKGKRNYKLCPSV